VAPPRPDAADRRARIPPSPRIRAVESQLGDLAAGGGPILAGPWRGSLEVELLYWIPFLRWFVRRFDVDPARVTAVSRPGADLWYADLCGTYSWTLGEARGPMLDPGLLDDVCGDFRRGRGPLVHVLDRLLYERVPAPPTAEPSQILFWPRDDEAVPAVPGDVALEVLEPVDRLDAAALTAAVGRARLLIGPWNGGLILGPMLGIPTVALTDPSSGSADLDLGHRAARTLRSPFVLLDIGHLDLVARLAAMVTG
jgi:hypothetical protein